MLVKMLNHKRISGYQCSKLLEVIFKSERPVVQKNCLTFSGSKVIFRNVIGTEEKSNLNSVWTLKSMLVENLAYLGERFTRK